MSVFDERIGHRIPVVVTVEANVAAPAAETTNLFVPFVANVNSVPSNAALELIYPA